MMRIRSTSPPPGCRSCRKTDRPAHQSPFALTFVLLMPLMQTRRIEVDGRQRNHLRQPCAPSLPSSAFYIVVSDRWMDIRYELRTGSWLPAVH